MQLNRISTQDTDLVLNVYLCAQVPGMPPPPTAYPGLPQGAHVPAYGDPRRDPLLRSAQGCSGVLRTECSAVELVLLMTCICSLLLLGWAAVEPDFCVPCAGATRTNERVSTAAHAWTCLACPFQCGVPSGRRPAMPYRSWKQKVLRRAATKCYQDATNNDYARRQHIPPGTNAGMV